MTNFDKACGIAGWIANLLNLDIVITAEDVLNKCAGPAELDYWYRIVCLDDYNEIVPF